MKKNWGIFIFYGFFFFVLFMPFFDFFLEEIPNPFDYARITELEYKAVLVDEVGSEGKVVITERITFDIHAFSEDNLFWELWRELPVDYIDGLGNDYQINYDGDYRQGLEDLLRRRWNEGNIDKNTGKPKPFPEDSMKGKYILRGKNREYWKSL